MANRANVLDRRLAQIDFPAKGTRAAAQEPVELAGDNERRWAHMVNHFWSEAEMSERRCIDRRVFDKLIVFLGCYSRKGEGESSRSWKLVLMLIFMMRGWVCSRSWWWCSSRTGSQPEGENCADHSHFSSTRVLNVSELKYPSPPSRLYQKLES